MVANAVIACQIGKVHIVDQRAKPRCEVERHSCTRDTERIFGGVPVLRVDIRVGCRTHVSQTAATGIRSYGLRNDRIVDWIEKILLFLSTRLQRELHQEHRQ